MKAVPRRLLMLGGGPVGVEMAQAVRRLGGGVTLVEGGAHVLAREAALLGEALGEVLRRDGIELILEAHATAARRNAEDYVLELDDGRELRGERLLAPPAAAPGWPTSLLKRSASRSTGAGSRSTRRCVAASACGRSAT
jgi:dihydrolipoamide dehydrogenase